MKSEEMKRMQFGMMREKENANTNKILSQIVKNIPLFSFTVNATICMHYLLPLLVVCVSDRNIKMLNAQCSMHTDILTTRTHRVLPSQPKKNPYFLNGDLRFRTRERNHENNDNGNKCIHNKINDNKFPILFG